MISVIIFGFAAAAGYAIGLGPWAWPVAALLALLVAREDRRRA